MTNARPTYLKFYSDQLSLLKHLSNSIILNIGIIMNKKTMSLMIVASLCLAPVANLRAMEDTVQQEGPSVIRRIGNVCLHTTQTIGGLFVTLISAATLTGAGVLGFAKSLSAEDIEGLAGKRFDHGDLNEFKKYMGSARNSLLLSTGLIGTAGITSTVVGIKGLVKDVTE